MIDDRELIHQFVADRSETAFTRLVDRHLKMVYAAALRQVNGDTQLAEDVTQTVFVDLARKAKKLQRYRSLAGWLYTSTRFAAANAARTEARRRLREQTAIAMNDSSSDANIRWEELRPVIDAALAELGETDREAIVLRFFESYEFPLVGAALGVSEDAARMRVDRALVKLRGVLEKRRMILTSTALAAVLAESSSTAVPITLASGITGAVFAHAAAHTTSSILTMLTMKKLAFAAAAMLAISATTVLVVRHSSSPAQPENAPETLKNRLTTARPGDVAPAPNNPARPDAFHSLLQRHDERVQAQQLQLANSNQIAWDNEVAKFDESLKDEPGLKKSGAKFQATLAPGESLLTGGWSNAPGKRTMVLVTPQVISGGANPDQIITQSRMISVPDEVVDSLGVGNVASLAAKFQSDQVGPLFQAMTNNPASEILGRPRIQQAFGTTAAIFIGQSVPLGTEQRNVGWEIKMFPTRSSDGVSIDLGMLMSHTELTESTEPQTKGE